MYVCMYVRMYVYVCMYSTEQIIDYWYLRIMGNS